MTYALVENGSVVETFADLPISWKNVSGLNRLAGDAESLAALGWYEVAVPEVSYDPATQILVNNGYWFNGSGVTETLVATGIPAEQADVVAAEIRSFRDMYLRDTDWTQLADVQSRMTTEKNAEWQEYRQALRDMPQTYAAAVKFSDVVWPTKPQ